MAGYEPVTILVGILAGSVAIMGSLVSRTNAVSGFRQQWINDQRADLATICSCAGIISSNIADENVEYFANYMEAYSRILLRVNPKKLDEWADVVEAIRVLYEKIWERRGVRHDVTTELRAIELLARWPLKENWSKTKHGEREFWIAGLVAALSIFISIGVALGGVKANPYDKKEAKYQIFFKVN